MCLQSSIQNSDNSKVSETLGEIEDKFSSGLTIQKEKSLPSQEIDGNEEQVVTARAINLNNVSSTKLNAENLAKLDEENSKKKVEENSKAEKSSADAPTVPPIVINKEPKLKRVLKELSQKRNDSVSTDSSSMDTEAEHQKLTDLGNSGKVCECCY
jgi:hypothetical protein